MAPPGAAPVPLVARCTLDALLRSDPPSRPSAARLQLQDALLLRCVAKHGPKNWSLIARSIPGRTGKSCRLRCGRVLRAGLGSWEPTAAGLHASGSTFLADCRRSSRPKTRRWLNQLNPNVKKDPFSGEEDAIIMAAHTLFGNKWASISKLLVGRCARWRALFGPVESLCC